MGDPLSLSLREKGEEREIKRGIERKKAKKRENEGERERDRKKEGEGEKERVVNQNCNEKKDLKR